MPKMTSEQAQTFSGYSSTNAAVLIATAEAKKCECEPYRDWFTYQRWLAQGFQVQKGERGIKLTTWIECIKKDADGNEVVTGRRPKGYTVFCKCQVKAMEPV